MRVGLLLASWWAVSASSSGSDGQLRSAASLPAPPTPAESATPSCSGPVCTLRIATYNVHAWRDSNHVENLERIATMMRAVQPDVIMLNEVLHPFVAPPRDDPYWEAARLREPSAWAHQPEEGTVPTPDAAENWLNKLAEELDMSHITFARASDRTVFGGWKFGNAIISRYPLVDVHHHLLETSVDDMMLGDQDRSIRDVEDRSAISARVLLPGKLGQQPSLGLLATHLDHRAEAREKKQRERNKPEPFPFVSHRVFPICLARHLPVFSHAHSFLSRAHSCPLFSFVARFLFHTPNDQSCFAQSYCFARLAGASTETDRQSDRDRAGGVR